MSKSDILGYKVKVAKDIDYEGMPSRMRVTYGWTRFEGNPQPPYFSITADIHGYNVNMSGCCHEEIRKYFPELAHLIAWHLTGMPGLPMHYEANSVYWFQQQDFEYAKSTIVYGALPSDLRYKVEEMTEEVFINFIRQRLPMLQVTFQEVMNQAGLLARVND